MFFVVFFLGIRGKIEKFFLFFWFNDLEVGYKDEYIL